MTQAQITCEAWSPEIEIPVCHSQIFILRFGINRERQSAGPIQNSQLIWNDFDIASREVRVFCAWHPRRNPTRNLNYVFAAQRMRLLRELRIFLGPENNLRQPF